MSVTYERRRNRWWYRIALACSAGLAVPLAAAGQANAEPVLDTVGAQIEFSDDGTASVSLDYSVYADEGDEEVPAEALSFSLLDFGEGQLSELQVLTAENHELDFTTETAGRKTTVDVMLDAPLAAGHAVELELTYEVLEATSAESDLLRGSVPILALDYPASANTPGTFTAQVRLPEDYGYFEAFPANVTEGRSDGETLLSYQAPAAPSVVQFSATRGAPPLLTTERIVEAILLVLIAAGTISGGVVFVRRRRATKAEDILANEGATSGRGGYREGETV